MSFLSERAKRNKKRKNLDNSISFRKPKSKEIQPPDIEIDFLIDSGAESNFINVPKFYI